jgi:catechol 2,3-dioxygenase
MNLENENSETGFRIHPATFPGHVHLTVANLENQQTFYQSLIGLQLHWREGDSVGLGVGGADLVRLTESRVARRYRGTTGMYHFAILLPNRYELARAIGRLLAYRYRNYPTDHIMTKTTYLDDPEGNNIELYTESPEDGTFGVVDGNPVAVRTDGTPSDGREPLDLEALFALLEPDVQLDIPMPPETRIGHYHLYVSHLDETMHFYHDILGFDDMGIAHSFSMGMVSAGRYHHHIGFNTWAGEGAPPAPADALGLKYFTFVLPNQSELEQVEERARRAGIEITQTENGISMRDPSQNTIVLAA